MSKIYRVLTIALALFALAACSGGSGGPQAAATPEGGLRLPPETSAASDTQAAVSDQQMTAMPCQRAELEDWLQRSGSLVFEYAQEVNNSLATPPGQMVGVLERLGALHSTLQDMTPPPCAVDHHAMIMAMMQRTIDALTGYAEGSGLDLATFATESNAAMDDIRVREAQLAAQYNSLPRP